MPYPIGLPFYLSSVRQRVPIPLSRPSEFYSTALMYTETSRAEEKASRASNFFPT
jgi:hypothetical protein